MGNLDTTMIGVSVGSVGSTAVENREAGSVQSFQTATCSIKARVVLIRFSIPLLFL